MRTALIITGLIFLGSLFHWALEIDLFQRLIRFPINLVINLLKMSVVLIPCAVVVLWGVCELWVGNTSAVISLSVLGPGLVIVVTLFWAIVDAFQLPEGTKRGLEVVREQRVHDTGEFGNIETVHVALRGGNAKTHSWEFDE